MLKVFVLLSALLGICNAATGFVLFEWELWGQAGIR